MFINFPNRFFQTVVKEDELLSRLEMLENQLQITAQTTTDDELKQRLSQLIEDKHKEERTTKEAVRSLLQEKIDFQSKLSQLQVSVSTANITYTSIHLTNIT